MDPTSEQTGEGQAQKPPVPGSLEIYGHCVWHGFSRLVVTGAPHCTFPLLNSKSCKFQLDDHHL